jgi:hypothetical protein
VEMFRICFGYVLDMDMFCIGDGRRWMLIDCGTVLRNVTFLSNLYVHVLEMQPHPWWTASGF